MLCIKKRNLLSVYINLIMLITLFFIPFKSSLVFYHENTNHILAYIPMEEGEHFQLIFKHSIHLTDVIEKYEIDSANKIVQHEMIYEQFGIGMPSNAEGDERFSYKDGKYVIENINVAHDVIKIRNGKTVSENRFVWGKEAENTIPLNKYIQPGKWFTIRFHTLSMFDMVKGVKIGE